MSEHAEHVMTLAECGDCGGGGWVCGGGPGCTLEDNLAGTEPDHETPCSNAVPCDSCTTEAGAEVVA